MAFNRFEVDEKAYKAAAQYRAERNEIETIHCGGLVGSQASTSTKEGEISINIKRINEDLHNLRNSLDKLYSILDPVLSPIPEANRLTNAIPNKTSLGGTLQGVITSIGDSQSIVDSIIGGIEL